MRATVVVAATMIARLVDHAGIDSLKELDLVTRAHCAEGDLGKLLERRRVDPLAGRHDQVALRSHVP